MALIVYEANDFDCDDKVDKQKLTSFVGLSNQGATCYLNGLLQTLFMTPEFRRAIFRWRYDAEKDGAEEHCIPLQLQKLFGYLNISKQKAVDTVALTKSFGWEGSEVFQQQDVQELTRVLFDALEESFKGTDSEDVIDQLYAGELVDYLRCIEVDYETERVDKFLDFSLAIIPFGSDVACKNVIECVEMYLRPEMLDGDNQYNCEKYKKKVDAMKGLKFVKLPKILSIHLKRFVYDFSSANITLKKVNDIVKFPTVLDMNKYVGARKREEGDSSKQGADRGQEGGEFEAFLQQQLNTLRSQQSDKSLREQVEDSSPESVSDKTAIQTNNNTSGPASESKGSAGSAEDPSDTPFNPFDDEEPDTLDKIGNKACAAAADPSDDDFADALGDAQLQYKIGDIPRLLETRGEWIYELYAVLMHSGSVSGGHYYAYIKDLDTKEWWNFNDSSVTRMKEQDIEAAWGSTYTYVSKATSYSTYTSAYSSYKNYPNQVYSNPSSASNTNVSTLSNANAYMLMYHKAAMPTESAVPLPTAEDVPEYIHEMAKAKEKEAEEKRLADLERRSRIGIRVHYKDLERRVYIKKTQTLLELTQAIWMEFKLEEDERFSKVELKKLGLGEESKTTEEGQKKEMKEEPNGEKTVEESNCGSNLSFSKSLQCKALAELVRLRDFNIYTKIVTKVYDVATKGLIRLEGMFYDMKDVMLETKTPEEEWEHWYEDGMTIKVNIYNPVDDVLLPDGKEKMFRVPKNATMGMLKDLIKPEVSQLYTKLRVMKIKEPVRNESIEGEIYTQPSKELKADLKFYEGFKVYVEEEGPDDRSQLKLSEKTSKCIARFAVQKKMIKITLEFFETTPKKPDVVIEVSKVWTVEKLRTKIASQLDLPENGFKIQKNYQKVELQMGTNTTLEKEFIYDKSKLLITLGTPTTKGHFSLKVSAFKPHWPLPKAGPEGNLHYLRYRADEQQDEETEPEKSEDNQKESAKTGSKVRLLDDFSEYEWDDDLPTGPKNVALFSEFDDDDDNGTIAEAPPPQSLQKDAPVGSVIAPVNATATATYPSSSDAVGVLTGDVETLTVMDAGVAAEACTVMNGSDHLLAAHAASAQAVPVDGVLVVAAIHDTGEKEVWEKKAEDSNKAGNKKALQLPAPVSSSSDPTNPSPSPIEGAEQHPAMMSELLSKTVEAHSAVPEVASGTEETEDSTFGNSTINFTTTILDFLALDMEVSVTKDTPVVDLRKCIFEQLQQIDREMLRKEEQDKKDGEEPLARKLLLQPHQTGPNFIRIRAALQAPHKAPADILRDGDTVGNAIPTPLTMDKNIQIQLLDHAEVLPYPKNVGDVIVLVQRWHRDTWTLGPRYEVYLPGAMRIAHIATKLAALLEIDDPENIKAVLVDKQYGNNIPLSSLPAASPSGKEYLASSKWFEPFEEQGTLRMAKSLKIAEGDLLIVQDSSEKLRELTEAEKRSVEKAANDKKNYVSSSYYGNYSYPSFSFPRNTGGVKIKTHKDRLKEEEDSINSTTSSSSSKDTSPGSKSPKSPVRAAGEYSLLGPELPPGSHVSSIDDVPRPEDSADLANYMGLD